MCLTIRFFTSSQSHWLSLYAGSGQVCCSDLSNTDMNLTKQAQLLRPFFWSHQRYDLKLKLIAALGCLILAKASNLATPWLLGLLVDDLNGEAIIPTWVLGAIGLVVVYALSRLFALVFSELREVFFTHVSQHAIRLLTRQTFAHLHQLPLDFHLSRHTGSLDRLVDRGTKAIDFLLRYIVFNVGPTLIELGLVCIIVWSLFGGFYALIITATVLIYIILTLKMTSWRLRFRREMNSADNLVAGRMVDSFVNVENVRLFTNENYEIERLDRGLSEYERAANQSRLSLLYLNLSQTLIVLTGVTAVLIMAALNVESGVLTVGGFVTLNTYILQAFQPLNFLGSIYRQIRQSLIDMESLFDVLDEPVENDAIDATHEVTDSRISFNDVHFAYESERPILQGVSFTVQPKQTVAIVGETGCGKTTIGKLLLKIIEPNQGSIQFGRHDLSQLKREAIRKAIGVVPQDTVLFNDTLGHNVRYGNVSATDDEVRAALRLAGMGEFLDQLASGLETEVGARGLKLSGGEKQRIAIARVILKNPPIVLLDEATSSLDVSTERQVQTNLEMLSSDRTTLVIAHRLSTIRYADLILVMHDGIISESGNFDDLLAANGRFKALWDMQQRASDPDDTDLADVVEDWKKN